MEIIYQNPIKQPAFLLTTQYVYYWV